MQAGTAAHRKRQAGHEQNKILPVPEDAESAHLLISSKQLNAAAVFEPPSPSALPLRQRIIIMTMVVIAHGVLLAQPWIPGQNMPSSELRVLSVNIVRKSAPRQNQPSQPLKKLLPISEHVHTETVPAKPEPFTQIQQKEPEQQAAKSTVPADAESEALPVEASVLPDHEPEYRAVYLDNPQPRYPLVARRMGWQGRVVLDVEVLADGTSGAVALKESSGHKILDDSAVRTVQGWRFNPARRSGIPVAKHFLVPIAFTLK